MTKVVILGFYSFWYLVFLLSLVVVLFNLISIIFLNLIISGKLNEYLYNITFETNFDLFNKILQGFLDIFCPVMQSKP